MGHPIEVSKGILRFARVARIGEPLLTRA